MNAVRPSGFTPAGECGTKAVGMARRRPISTEQAGAKTLVAWFALTPGERLFVAGVLAIFLIGLVARYHHLKHLEAVPVPDPEERVERGEK